MLSEIKKFDFADNNLKTLKEVTQVAKEKVDVSNDLRQQLRKVDDAGDRFSKLENLFDEAEEKSESKSEQRETDYKENKLARLDENYQLTPEERKQMEGWSDAEVNQFVADANYYKEHGQTNFEDYKQHLIRQKNGLENQQNTINNADTGNQNQNLESNDNNYQESANSGTGGGTGMVEGGGGGSSSGGGVNENNDLKVTDQGGDKVITDKEGQEQGRAIPLDDGSYNLRDKQTGKVTNVRKDEKTGEYVATDTDNGNEVGRMTEAEAREKYGY